MFGLKAIYYNGMNVYWDVNITAGRGMMIAHMQFQAIEVHQTFYG